mgnify:CR=1 FL=1
METQSKDKVYVIGHKIRTLTPSVLPLLCLSEAADYRR